MSARYLPMKLSSDCISKSTKQQAWRSVLIFQNYANQLSPRQSTSTALQFRPISSLSRLNSVRMYSSKNPKDLHGGEDFTNQSHDGITNGSLGVDRPEVKNISEGSIKTQVDESPYLRAIKDLNLLQSNTQVLALAKYKKPETILPLFEKQLNFAGIDVRELDKLNVIHVSGTKGKGSTCAFTESILREAGLKTGFYNSPHLIKVTERIRINGEPIDSDKFCIHFRYIFDRLMAKTKGADINMPSYFSFLTILAFHIFLEEKVDCAIIEVGIGGEYDPTNIIRKPIVCGITTLDYDHTNILGKTIESIAWSKAGIAKTDVPIVVLEQEQDSAMKMIKSRARERGASLFICKAKDARSPENYSIHIGIDGQVQLGNATLASLMSAKLLLSLDEKKYSYLSEFCSPTKEVALYRPIVVDLNNLPETFKKALRSCSWPGRCQIIKYPRATFYIDGAHTRKSMENCLDWFLKAASDEEKETDFPISKVLIVNIIGERDKQDVLRPLTKFFGFDLVIFSSNRINSAGDTAKSETFVNIQGPSNEKSMENVKSNASAWQNLLKESGDHNGEVKIMANISDSIKLIDDLSRSGTKKRVQVLATGSLHFVGAILETLSILKDFDCG